AVSMKGTGDQFFTSAALPYDQNGHDRVSGASNLVVDRQHARRPSNQLARRYLDGDRLSARPTACLIERALHDLLDLADIERLADVVKGARPHGFNRRFK